MRFICGTAPDLGEAAGRADAVLLMDVLEHVPDDAAVLGSIVDALRPGCHVLITVPADMKLWSSHDVSLAARGESRSYEGSTQSIRRTTLTRMAMGTRETDQPPLWIATSDLPTSPGHPFYARLTTLLERAPLRSVRRRPV